MATISLCMIVKNEEATLERCLASIQDIVDEIILVDTGSTDKTKEIAQEFSAKIYDFQWIDDFSAARNYSFSQATMDYILWLDADDIILPEDGQKLKELKNVLNPLVDVVMMKYNTGFDAQGNVTFSFYRERLSKRSCNFKWHEPVHEYLQYGGKLISVDICVTHKKIHPSTPGRNLSIYKKMIANGQELTARGLYYFARELKDNGRTLDAIEYFNKFLDSERGWVEDNICACGELAKCYKNIGDRQKYLQSLLNSFKYDAPRAEICCYIGYFFKDQNEFKIAAFWFELATNLKRPQNSWGFVLEDYWGYIPYIELCYCLYQLGDNEQAIKYNNKAAEFKPDDPSILYNKKYFEKIK